VLGAKIVLAKIDSQVVAGQVEKEYIAREPELIKYLATVRALERRFQGFNLQYVPRAENIEAEELAKAASKQLANTRLRFLPIATSISNASNGKGIQNSLNH
jgi:ribonuclease HI